MKNNKTLYIFIGSLVLIFAVIVGTRYWSEAQPGTYDELAQCIADSGAKFYGAFWCPHCTAQKEAFGNSYKLLPYIECSLPDKSGQTQECIDAGITGYPTWRFSDGSELSGNIPLAVLAEKTNCPFSGETTPIAEQPAEIQSLEATTTP